MKEQPEAISTHAVAKMPSARLSLADLEFIASSMGEVRRVALTWSSREMYTVTASNFSGQSPSVKVVRTFKANSVAEFATQAPRGRIYILEARFESPGGAAVLTLGKDRDLSRDLVLSFEGAEEGVPSWFDDIVRGMISAKLFNAGQREIYLLGLAWAPVFLPPIAVPWAIATGRLSSMGISAVLWFGGFAWLAYAVFAPTIARFIRASSLRVTPLFAAVPWPQPANVTSPFRLIPLRLREFRTEVKIAFKSGWLAFRQSDHQFNAVLVSLVALVVALVSLIVDVSK
ncbi:hypothetical protein [Micromonospora coxensis]|uniref:hypothetical protein n=1 Tax=Micromonospora coxensis TaxID=356852 RepID=UPI001E418F0D|nr:hypothetical protein [Micromonospora coxensis]